MIWLNDFYFEVKVEQVTSYNGNFFQFTFNMVRVISQETFDNVVKENMEEFGMQKEEAIKEAKDQFQAQVSKLTGVSLRGIKNKGNPNNPKPMIQVKAIILYLRASI